MLEKSNSFLIFQQLALAKVSFFANNECLLVTFIVKFSMDINHRIDGANSTTKEMKKKCILSNLLRIFLLPFFSLITKCVQSSTELLTIEVCLKEQNGRS